MKVFVTGASGFLGKALCEVLTAREDCVFSLVREGASPASLRSSGRSVGGDIRDTRASAYLSEAFLRFDVDAVVHLAAQTEVGSAKENPIETFRTNIAGTWAVLEAARRAGVRRVLVASSDKAYGRSLKADERYRTEDPLLASFPYETSKACADMIAQAYRSSYGMDVRITRCGNLYGPGHLNRTALIPGTIRSVLRGERPVLRGPGLGYRDYLYIDDAVRGYITLLTAQKAPVAVNFGTGIGTQTSVIAEMVCSQMKWAGGIDRPAYDATYAALELDRQIVDPASAASLGWAPRIGLADGLGRTIDWWRRRFEE